jgi:hypothetical protein
VKHGGVYNMTDNGKCIVIVKKDKNAWETVEFKDIKKGDIVKLLEPDIDEQVLNREIEAKSDAYLQEDGVYMFIASI